MKENTIAKKSYYCISFLFLLAIWLVGTPVKAQNVVVSPSTGKLIAAYTSGTEEGFENGCSALWRHNQLPLTITVADDGKLTAGKELANPAGNMNVSDDKMVLLGGKKNDSYMLVSLPRGYRFTGYSITLQNNLNGVTAFGTKWGAIDKTFYETNSNFDWSNPLGTAKDAKGNTTMSGSNSQDKSGEFTLSRQGTDMGNRLYFILHRGSNALFGVTIKSFELHFSIDKFTVALNVNPISENEKKSLVEAPFKINKPELGGIKPHSKAGGNTYYSYSYENVADMIAYNSLYQQDAVDHGKAADVATTKTISCLVNGGKKWFGLGNNTYYVESPTTIKNANGTDMPVGYRITGAKLTCSWGTNSPTAGYVITYNNGDEFYYLGIGGDNKLKFTTSPSVWQMDDDHLHQGNQYICKKNNNDLYTGSSSNYAATFKIEDGKLTYKGGSNTYYLTYTTNGDAERTTDPSKAVNIFSNDAYNVPTSDYTVKLYGTDPNTSNPLTETISATNASKVMEITGLNNDAVKFTVEGLKGNSQALVSVELTMEALNPYIHSLDIVSHDDSNGSSKTITQTFTASNFMVRGEHFTFHVPKNQTGAWWFSFENLKSDYADDTYYDQKGTGNSRYCFVSSDYYTHNTDLYQAKPDASFVDKVKTVKAGTKPFRFSNIDELVNTNQSQEIKYLEEYPFTLKDYGEENFVKFELDDKTDQKDKIAYLFTCDETRYNIAPTTATQHRYYAYYLMDIEIEQKDYEPKFTFKKIYDSSLATTDKGDDTSSQWGVEVTTTETDGTGYGYLSLNTIMKGLSAAIHGGTTSDHPTEMRQLLYMDLSKLNEVIVPENPPKPPYAEALASLSPNAIIYLPFGTTVNNTDNCAAATTKSGDFYATRNIILTDKTPLYIPYQINVPAEYYAKYTRNITVSKYGKARNATIMLPFTLSINDKGEHTNSGKEGDQLSFTVNKLQKSNCISKVQGDNEIGDNEINEGKGWYVHFIPYTSSTKHTEANVPYMVHVTNAPTDEDVSFTALEYGSNIMATTQVRTDGKITGDPCTGIYDNKNVTLTPVATYCGTQLHKNASKCFYWGNNFFNSSWTLSANYDKVNIRPFRSWFSCEGFSTAKAATLYAFFGENTATATGISNVEQKTDGLTIEGTAGALLIRSPYSQTLDIRNTQGILVKRVTLRAGEQSETYLPAGIYIAAGKKVMVK